MSGAITPRVHLRPARFVDTPVGYDGEVARLAGGLNWFAAYDVLAAGRRVETVPVAGFDRWLAGRGNAAALAGVHAAITAPRAPFALGERVLRFDQPVVAGILNATPDSFSDGGRHVGDPAAAAAAGAAMAEAGAGLIDVGGESTRPGATTVWEADEAARVVPVIERLTRAGALVSVDTRKATVMEAALAVGAAIVNDVSALLWDDRAVEVVARARCPVIVMHSPDPRTGGHGRVAYADVVGEVFDWLAERVSVLRAAGVERIVVDPGIGFGKGLADNLALLGNLAVFHGLGCPVMLGASRKRLIGALSNEAPAGERLGGSVALALMGAQAGVQMLRVHDVAETVQALRVWRGLRDRALAGG